MLEESETVLIACLFSGVVALAASYGHTCAAISNGSIYCWGNNDNWKLGTGDTSSKLTPSKVNGPQEGDAVHLTNGIHQLIFDFYMLPSFSGICSHTVANFSYEAL
jgi:alpha-tubulin suppressor-like RCC1 family protein